MDKTAGDNDWLTLWRSGVLPRFCFISLGLAFHAGAENMISTLMPAIVRDIGGVQFNGWTFSIYEIGSIVAGALTGRLCAIWPVRLNMTAAALVYAVGSLITAFSPAMAFALGGRLLTGFGGGALITLCFVALQRFFRPAVWPQLMAILSAVWGIAAFGGPLYGGIVGEFLGWRWAFILFAVAAVVYAGSSYLVLRDEPVPPRSEPQGRLPLIELGCLALGITAIAAAGIESRPMVAAALAAAGLAGIVGSLRLDGREGASRLFPSNVFKLDSIVGNGLLMVVALAISTCSFGFYGPLLLAALHGFSPITTGLIIASESISWSLLSIAVARAPQDREKAIIRAGAVMIPLGIVGFAFAIPSGSMPVILIFSLLQGGGFGILWPFVNRMVVEAAPARDKEITGAAFSTVQRIGYAVGGALSGIVANAHGFSAGFSKAAASTAAMPLFLYFVPLALVGCFLGFKLTGRIAMGELPS